MTIAWAGCGGGGGGGGSGGGSFPAQVTLVDVSFPDPSDQSSGGDERLPNNASLIQRIVLTFSDRVDPDQISSSVLVLRDASTREEVNADFEVNGAEVVIHPALPVRPIQDLGGDEWDLGGAGLAPHTIYELTVPVDTAGSLPALTRIAPDLFARYDYEEITEDGTIGRNFAEGTREGTLSVLWRTTRKPERFLSGYEPVAPELTGFVPPDGSDQVSPKLFTDPGHHFAAFEPYRLVFDQPLDPAADNVGDQTFELVGLADEHGDPPAYQRLGVDVHILENHFDRCLVEVVPSGVLPFGHRLGLSVARALRQISGGSRGGSRADIVSEFTVARAKHEPMHDTFRETFATSDREETSRTALDGNTRADWDRLDSHWLQSAFGFEGGGELGPFLPLAPQSGTRTITFDTNQQFFPLLDGSTPGAPTGGIVLGGVFNFTDIVIPAGIIVTALGRNPLVLTATGSVSIAGVIDVSGRDGGYDFTNNSSISPIAGGLGGPGAGRGGASHPTIVEGPFTYMNFLPPRIAIAGEAPALQDGRLVFPRDGGGAGECGINQSPPVDCTRGTGNSGHGAGGGGGTFLVRGDHGVDGVGDMTSREHFDPSHNPMFFPVPGTFGGAPGHDVFVDADPGNDFIGKQGEVTMPMGGQGGGGAGSRLDSLFCTLKNWPATTTDSRGGGGGGGGGALVIRSLGPITLFAKTAQLLAVGGNGGVGQPIGCGGYGGGGGGGSGGLISLDSATMVTLDDTDDQDDDTCSETKCPPGCDMDLSVDGGEGGYIGCQSCVQERQKTKTGAGGRGGAGLVQLMVPIGFTPEIGSKIFIHPKLKDGGSVVRTPPSEITPVSVAQSTWIDVGQIIARPNGSPSWRFAGTDPTTGYVVTDAEGYIPDPRRQDIRIDMMPVLDPVTGEVLAEGRGDFIPTDATIRVEFQAGDAVAPGAKEVAESSITPWSPSIAVANGRQFLRYRITFNIADLGKNPDVRFSPDTRLATVRQIRMPFDF